MNVARFETQRKAFATSILALLLGLGGCIETDGPSVLRTEKESTCTGGGTPRKSVAKDILSAFYPCCDGTAHLIPDFFVPKDFRAMLATGPNSSICVPDEFASDANYTPKKCTSLFGQPGACMSICIPQVKNAPVALPKDVCPGNQLCAPCIDPQTNKESGACNQGAMACEPAAPSSGCTDYLPTLDISSYSSCCSSGMAHCAPANLVTEKDRKDLETCNGGVGYCVPDEFLKRGGRYTPPTCKSMGDREGRCLSTCVPAVAKDVANLPQSSCLAHERCVPCYDPRTGLATGACGKGCDKGPVEGPRQFQPCGVGATDAYCVPSYLVPAAEAKKFDNSGCLPKGQKCNEPNTLCLPKKVIDAGLTYSPAKCKASLPGFMAGLQQFFGGNWLGALQAMQDYSDGRCLSKCIGQIKPDAGLLGKDSCDVGEVCAPCFDPRKVSQGKVATGACDR
jgi:hypothetical protein